MFTFIKENDKNVLLCQYSWWRKSHVNKFSQNDKIPLCCIVHVVFFLYAIMHVFC